MTDAAGRLLIVGGTGMLGHRTWLEARRRASTGSIDAFVTVRDDVAVRRWPTVFDADHTVVTGDVTQPDALPWMLDAVQPTVVLNAVGVIKQRMAGVPDDRCWQVNAQLPHDLADQCAARGVRLIHVSTDCVFSGVARGPRAEGDTPDPVDLYGRSKLAGEPYGPGCLTLRTSMIGRELSGEAGLLEWFLTQRGGTVGGYRNAVFSGLASPALASVLLDVVERHADLEGLYHLAAEPIDKLALLLALDKRLAAGITVDPLDTPRINRWLDGTRFAAATGITVDPWDSMLDVLADEVASYEALRAAG